MSKNSIPDSMKGIIDEDLLNERKAASHLPKKREGVKSSNKIKEVIKQFAMSDFTDRQDSKGLFYGHHKDWKSKIWIGPYKTKEALNKVILDYIADSKRSPLNRKGVNNLHSIIMEEKDWK